MGFDLQFFSATGQVTGSLYVIRCGSHTVLLECGLRQGSAENEGHNRDPFPFAVQDIDAVVLSHAHIDHSGRVPLLVNRGYEGPVFVQNATGALCEIMLPDSGYINEKDAEWENRKRSGTGKAAVQPLYTRAEAEKCLEQFVGVRYREPIVVVPDLTLVFHDAGHILGSAIVELIYTGDNDRRTLVFSGDLGYRDAPVMGEPEIIECADLVLLESTYGDRLHRPITETMQELTEIFAAASATHGNILIPAFTVGRTQDLLFLMAENYERWNLDAWHVFLDSPMAIDATKAYSDFSHLHGASLFSSYSGLLNLPNFHATRSSEESMEINDIGSGAIVIAGSGMCSGGRIRHHLKNNIWRPECHLIVVGYQAIGTPGRRIVDGAETVKLWGDDYRVRIQVHTVGGLSAHADQADLIAWYAAFKSKPPVYLVHGEREVQRALADKMKNELAAPVSIAEYLQKVKIESHVGRA